MFHADFDGLVLVGKPEKVWGMNLGHTFGARW